MSKILESCWFGHPMLLSVHREIRDFQKDSAMESFCLLVRESESERLTIVCSL